MQSYATQSDADRVADAGSKLLGAGWKCRNYRDGNAFFVYWQKGHVFVYKELKGYSASISMTEGSCQTLDGSTQRVFSRPTDAISAEIDAVRETCEARKDASDKEADKVSQMVKAVYAASKDLLDKAAEPKEAAVDVKPNVTGSSAPTEEGGPSSQGSGKG